MQTNKKLMWTIVIALILVLLIGVLYYIGKRNKAVQENVYSQTEILSDEERAAKEKVLEEIQSAGTEQLSAQESQQKEDLLKLLSQ